jgi:branched-chain amino acid transport system permease protein
MQPPAPSLRPLLFRRTRPAVVLILLAVLAEAPFLLGDYELYILTLVCIYCVASLGMNILTAYSKQLSMGNAAFFGLGAYSVGILTADYQAPFLLCLLVAMAVAGLAGVIVGLPAARLRDMYLAIATLAFLLLFDEVANDWRDLTHGALGLPIPQLDLGWIDLHQSDRLFWAVLVSAAGMFWVARNIMHSKFGRAFIALGTSEPAAAASGIDVMRYRVIASVVSAVITGFAGAWYAALVRYVVPSAFDTFLTVNLLTMVVVGGRGVIGAILGAVFVILIPELARNFGYSSSGPLLVGVGLLATLYLAPNGLSALRFHGRRSLAKWSRHA